MAESRRAPRRSTKRNGKALLGDRTELTCTIRDLSQSGARLAFQHPTFLPRTFRLRFDEEDQRVTVMWRRGLYAGVRFQTPLRLVPEPKRTKWFSALKR